MGRSGASLPEPGTPGGRAGLAALLADPGHALLAVDFDGTLAPIVADPPTARPAPGSVDALTRLSARLGRVAVVTGRPAGFVADVAGLAVVPGLLVFGQYGLERWTDGVLTVPDQPVGMADVRTALPALLAAADPGVWVEDKELSLVVHTRRAADPLAALAELTEPVRALAEAHGLATNAGRNVLEIRPPGVDKGGALRALVDAERPTAVLFAGDDLGDLPAFSVVAELRADGLPGLTVASASPETAAVADRADLVVDGPAGVTALLAALAAALD